MSNLTFGLDLGTNSIGWAVVNIPEEEIIGMGSVIFPMGVELEKGVKEVSKNETRREKRQMRRQLFRKKIRKSLLVKELMDKGLFPDINALHEKYYKESADVRFEHRLHRLLREKVLCPELAEFFALDPYEMRSKAYEGYQLTSHQLGRILYQFSLRRGYRETLQDGEEAGAIYKGNPGEGRKGIHETLHKIEAHGTLGNYLHNEDPHSVRLRNRYTLRSMYTNEFDNIFESQKSFFPDILDDQFYKTIGFRHATDTTKNGILFYQRKLRSQKHLLGNCQYETDKPVAPKSCLDFEVFRAWTFATNIKANGESISADEQIAVVNFMLGLTAPKPFKDLVKKLNDPQANYNYANDEKLPASPTHAGLRRIFKKSWAKMSAKEKEDLWHLKYWADDPDWLEKHLTKKYGLEEKEIKSFKKIRLAAGYASMSRKAILAITKFLKKGYLYDEAVLLAGVKKALGKKWDELSPSDLTTVEDTTIAIAKDGTSGPAIDRVKSFLREHFQLEEKELKRLYHHSLRNAEKSGKHLPEPENVRNPVVQQAMHQLRKLYNEMVDEYGEPAKVRVELTRDLKGSRKERDKRRKTVSDNRDTNIEIKALLDEYNQPHSVRNIHKVLLYNEIKSRYGKAVSPFNPSQTIGLEELFHTGNIQIEHIIPYSKSLNNSLGNKTLCHADTNRAKGNKSPYEYFTSIGADWEQVKSTIFDILPYQKAKRFISEKNIDADDFISRQLNDTRYISRYAVGYLRKACSDVDILQGTVSSLLRHHWGLDSILTPAIPLDVPNGEYFAAIDESNEIVDYQPWQQKEKPIIDKLAKKGKVFNGNVLHGKFYPKKDRLDHRHHAIDALVVALSKRSHLQQLSTAHAKEVDFRALKSQGEHIIERPWESIWTDTRKAVANILVYHHQNNRVLSKNKKRLFDNNGKPLSKNGKTLYSGGYSARGPLHKESVYGAHPSPTGGTAFHIRKSIDFIQTEKHLKKVVDKGIRQAILSRLESIGVKINDPKGWDLKTLDADVKKTVFFETDEEGTKHPQVYLNNKNGTPIPIKKVRIREEIGNAEQLKDGINQYVNPKNNHHIMISHNSEGKMREDVVTFWTAVERAKQHQPIYQAPNGWTPWFSMEENDLFLMGLPDHLATDWQNLDHQLLSAHLYRVQKLSSLYYVFRKHNATSIEYDSQMLRIQSFSALSVMNPVKARLGVTGNLQPW